MTSRRRILNQPAFILHHYAYSETSLLLDLFTRSHGRVVLIAKGVKKKKSRIRGILLPFQPLIVAWSGGGEVKALTNAEPLLPRKFLQREALFCGYYINELVLRLLHRADPHERVFDNYEWALDALAEDNDLEHTLRIFEKRLLQDVGYGLHLEKDPQSGQDIQSSQIYRYILNTGPVRDVIDDSIGVEVHGESLQALESEEHFTMLHRRELKKLTRAALDQHLEGRILQSRIFYGRLFQTRNTQTVKVQEN